MGMPAYINLDEFIPSRLALEQLPEEFAKRLKVLPVALNKATSVLTLAYSAEPVSYTHSPSPRDQRGSRMPSSA